MVKESNPEVLVSCQGVSKKFCRNLKKSLWYGIRDGVSEILTGQSSDELRKEEFWALKEISFELRRGECLGLLGRNGAGKTTLLKVLSGLIKPDQGTLTLKGSVGGLIALGAGFDGILSGRENIKINGAVLGFSSREVNARIEEIIDFAEISQFIDAPVNTYSSGMTVRLGFAVAAILTKPDILLLDEVLAVGDFGFTMKCLNTVKNLMNESAVIFVSHNLQYMSKFSTSILELSNGSCIFRSKNVQVGIDRYMNQFNLNSEELLSEQIKIKNYRIICNDVEIEKKNGVFKLDWNSKITFVFDIVSNLDIKVDLNLSINDNPQNHVISYKTIKCIKLAKGTSKCINKLGRMELNKGKYYFCISLIDSFNNLTLLRIDNISPIFINNDKVWWSNIIRSHDCDTKFLKRLEV